MSDAPSILGKYQLLKPLARGRSGEVWKARSHGVEGFEKVVVVKRLSDALSQNEAFLGRFIAQAKTAVMLTHANIAQVFDLGLEGGTYFLAMEYVRGPALSSVLSFCAEYGHVVAVPLAIHIVSELAKGLDYAHRRRDAELRPLSIVHGHVAPESVLLSYEGDVKLTDFGMARAREVVWPIGALPELVAYRAPEQVRGEAIDARADVYALGMILHELLAGVRVRAVETLQQTLVRAAQGGRITLGGRFDGHPPPLRALVERATAPRREARIANAGLLYEQLIELLYESGKRVGALDLARWLESLSAEAARAGDTLGPGSGHQVLADIEVDPEPQPAREQTPPPGSRDAGSVTPPASPSGQARARLATGAAPSERIRVPRAEWRDVSVLLVEGAYGPELSERVARYGGTPLDASEPPAFVFGLHDVDGRDAQAAARCALRVVRGRGGERVRAIVHSGRLLIAADGSDAESEARGTLRNAAMRGLRRATGGELIATAQAAPLLQSRFEVLPERVPGAPRRIVRELSAHEGLGKFIGRRDALRRIGEVFAQANRGELRVLGIRGEAGAGKSRLIVEMARRLHQAGHDVAFHTAVCAPQGRGTPLSAMQMIARAVLGLEELEAPGRAREQVDRLRLLGLSVEQRAAIARLLGLPAPRAVHSARLSAALRRVAYKLAAERLTVFVWDGTENMDDASCALLHRLLAAPLAARVLVVLAYRSEARAPGGVGWGALPSFTEVYLEGLASEDLARLVRHRLGASAVQGELVQAVQEKTSGNPLFVEELLSALRQQAALSTEQGVVRLVSAPSVALPRTLRGLVAARAANLPPRERLLLQFAATLGTRVTPRLLARAAELDPEVVETTLRELVERDILREAREGGFRFAHHLLQEVLYEAIPEAERPALHAAVARAAEALPDEPESTLERRAHHHRLAGERAEAIACLTRAGEQYEARYALEAAVEAYSQVLSLLTVDDDAPSATERGRLLALHAHIGELAYHSRTGEQVAERLGVALELAETWGREGYVARFAMLRGRLLNRAWRFREGRLWLDRALTMARKLDDRLLERDVALAAAEAHARNGEYTAVVPYVTEALTAARATGDVASEVQALLLFATTAASLGQCRRARDALSQLEELVGRHRVDRHVRVGLEHVRALVLDAAGERPEALTAARRALDMAKELALPYEVASHAHYLGGLHLRADEDKRAFAALRLSHELACEHDYTRLRFRNVFFLGFLDAMRFDAAQGHARMEQALTHAEERGYVVDLIDERYLLAMVAQKRGNLSRARSLLHAVIELGEPNGHVRICDDADRALRALAEGRLIALPR